jgi:hypothetical protein
LTQDTNWNSQCTCFSKDTDGTKIATTQRDGNLYWLSMLDYNTTKEDKIDTIAQLSIVEKYTNVELWRCRFGHLGMDGYK